MSNAFGAVLFYFLGFHLTYKNWKREQELLAKTPRVSAILSWQNARDHNTSFSFQHSELF